MNAARYVSLDSESSIVIGEGGNNGLYYTVNGLVMFGRADSANTAPVSLIPARQWFGATLSHQKPDFLYEITSPERCQLLFLPEDQLRDIAERNNEVYKLLYTVSAERLTKSIELVCGIKIVATPLNEILHHPLTLFRTRGTVSFQAHRHRPEANFGHSKSAASQ